MRPEARTTHGAQSAQDLTTPQQLVAFRLFSLGVAGSAAMEITRTDSHTHWVSPLQDADKPMTMVGINEKHHKQDYTGILPRN